MKTTQPKYIKERPATCNAILDWIQATQEFQRYYKKIGEILQEKQQQNHLAGPLLALSGHKPHGINNLVKLRQRMNYVLETLLVDMDNSSETDSYSNSPSNALRAAKLITHTQLIKQLNRKISHELMQFATPQA